MAMKSSRQSTSNQPESVLFIARFYIDDVRRCVPIERVLLLRRRPVVTLTFVQSSTRRPIKAVVPYLVDDVSCHLSHSQQQSALG